MTFGLKPVAFNEIASEFEKEISRCVSMVFQAEEHLCKCFLVPEVTSKVEQFRKMGSMDDDNHTFELTHNTTNQVKVYMLCPLKCSVFMGQYRKQIILM